PVEKPVIHENIEARKGTKAKALRRLIKEGKVSRDGTGKKGSPYVYSKAGFVVPTICREPENQNLKSAITSRKDSSNASSQKLGLFAECSTSRELETEVDLAD